MATDNSLQLSQAELRHHDVMRCVVDEIQDTPYVLKGGTALLLTRELPRHSTDLDFDSAQKVNIERRILEGMKKAGVELIGITRVKDTDTTQRFKAHYLDPVSGKDTLLKVETSFREAPNPADVELVNGIRTYTIPRIYDQKLDAVENRTAPRDLFDLAHLTKRYADQLSNEQIFKAEILTDDLELLRDRFHESFADDNVVSRSTTAEDTVIIFRDAVDEETIQRFNKRQFQNPAAMSQDERATRAKDAQRASQAALFVANRVKGFSQERLLGERDLMTGRPTSDTKAKLPPKIKPNKSESLHDDFDQDRPKPPKHHYDLYFSGADTYENELSEWSQSIKVSEHAKRKDVLEGWYGGMPTRREILNGAQCEGLGGAGDVFNALKAEVKDAGFILGQDSQAVQMMEAERLDLVSLYPKAHEEWVFGMENEVADILTKTTDAEREAQRCLHSIDEKKASAIAALTAEANTSPSR